MRQENELGPAEREVEEALGSLRLSATTIDRDRLMYEAGRRSVGRHRSVWQALSLLLVVGIGLLWAVRPVPSSVERIVYVNAEPRLPSGILSSSDLPATAGFRLYRKVLAEGPDALPDVRGGSSVRTNEGLTLHDLLWDSPRGI